MLSPAHRRSIHSSLTPILGGEETEALMSEFPASASDMPATKSDLALLRHDVERQFDGFRVEMHDLFRRMMMWMISTIVVAMIGGMGVAAAVAQAVGGG